MNLSEYLIAFHKGERVDTAFKAMEWKAAGSEQIIAEAWLAKYQDVRLAPTKNIIDLSVLIDGIDCWFFRFGCEHFIGVLRDVSSDGEYKSTSGPPTECCQPRLNHLHAWEGGDKCPIPEGFEIEVTLRGGVKETGDSDVWNWKYRSGEESHADIIAFRILRKLDNWVYPWEIEK